MVDWFEDESFWKATEPFLFPPDRLASAPDEIGAVLSLAGVEDGDVLDLCCGPGRHSIELARRGFRVTGVDRSSFLLGRARDLASEAGVDVEWVRQDMRRFARDEAFDLVLSMFTSFGYFDDPSDDVAVLRNVHRSLRPGGTLVLDAAGKEWLAREFQPTTSEVLPDGAVLVQRHEVVDDWSRVRNEWIVIRDGRARTFRFQLTIFSARELKDRLASAGFEDVRVHGDLQGSEYGPDCSRLVVVARKQRG